jgi:hypothetical protein
MKQAPRCGVPSEYLAPKVGDAPKSAGVEGDAPGRLRGRRWVGAGPLDAIAKAAAVTQREAGGRALIHSTVTSATRDKGVTESGSFIFDDSGRTRGTLTVKGLSTGREVKVLSIADGTTAYMSSDQFQSVAEGKKWMELDFSSAAKGAGFSIPADEGPKQGLKILERVQDAEEIGKEDIDGVPTTHYRGTLPTPEEVFGVSGSVNEVEGSTTTTAIRSAAKGD